MTSTELNSTHMDDDTALAPSDDATEHAYAWSLAETTDLDAPTERYSWGTATWISAGVLVAAAAIIAIAFAVLGWTAVSHGNRTSQVPTAAAPAAPIPAAAPVAPPAPAPSVAAPAPTSAPPATPDTGFIDAMKAAGIETAPDGWPLVIYNAHRACWELGHGYTHTEAVNDIKAHNPHITYVAANDYVGNAIAFYCPEYSGE